MQSFHPLKNYRFYIFSRETIRIRHDQNMTFLPVDRKVFSQSLIGCSGIISGAGFETPAEALKLKKKLMVIPIRGQYEQLEMQPPWKKWV